MAKYDMKIAHGSKANAEKAIADGRLNEDDIVIFSETDDEIGIVNHSNELKRIKSRTNEDIVLTEENIGDITEYYTIPMGSSVDDLIVQFKAWLASNAESINNRFSTIENNSKKIDVLEKQAKDPTLYIKEF